MKNVRGFTLIELLIVISIIGILSAIGLVLYSTVLKQSRDSKRQSDLKSIQLALEQYNNDQGFYPLPYRINICPPTDGSAGTGTLKVGCPLTDPAGRKKYLDSVPDDPSYNPSHLVHYRYVAIDDRDRNNIVTCNNVRNICTNYCLYALLESLSSSDLKGCPTFGSYNFAVTPP